MQVACWLLASGADRDGEEDDGVGLRLEVVPHRRDRQMIASVGRASFAVGVEDHLTLYDLEGRVAG